MEIIIIMNKLAYLKALLLAFWSVRLSAATLDVSFSPMEGRSADPFYPETSTLSVGTSSLAGVVPTLTGRGYGVEQTGNFRWGITAGPLAWNPAKTGWTVRNGFAPDALGSTTSTSTGTAVQASYLSLVLNGLPTGTVFSGANLAFNEVTFIQPSRAWAGTSADGFQQASPLTFSLINGSRSWSVALGDFTNNAAVPLEIRIYGVIGSDEGAFKVVHFTADALQPLVRVPEPDVRTICLGVGLAALIALRRRSNDLPRKS
jgi:hypothetical protein